MGRPTGRGGPSGLADVLDVLLDKGLVIDAFVRVSLVGIELLTVDARIVVASVDTYLRFAEAVNRLDLNQVSEAENLPNLMRHGAEDKTRRALGGDESDRQPEGDERQDGQEGDDGGSGFLDALGKAASKVRERGKWDE